MAEIRVDQYGKRVKKKPEIFKRKGTVTPHRTHSVAKRKSRGIPSVERALKKGGFY